MTERPSHQAMVERIAALRTRLDEAGKPLDFTRLPSRGGLIEQVRARMQAERLTPLQVMTLCQATVREMQAEPWPACWLLEVAREAAVALHGQTLLFRMVSQALTEVTDLTTVGLIEGAWAAAAHGYWLCRMYVAQLESVQLAWERVETAKRRT